MTHLAATLTTTPMAFTTQISSLDGSYITSEVTLADDIYTYRYTVDIRPLSKHEISNITVYLCDPSSITSSYADDSFQFVLGDGFVKFDSIQPEGDTFVFGFSTTAKPENSYAIIKASNQTQTDSVLAPICIPEPSLALISSLGMILLLLKRKRQ